jgi:hypothetical protein
MSANIKASTDGTQAIIGVGGVDQMTVNNAGVVTANSFVGLNSSSVTATGSTTARTLANRFSDVVNVKDFGAVGNGVADDTAAIQAAINYASSNVQDSIWTIGPDATPITYYTKPRIVYFPSNIYRIQGTLLLPNAIILSGNNSTFIGNGYSNADNNCIETGYISGGNVISNIGTPYETQRVQASGIENIRFIKFKTGLKFQNFNEQSYVKNCTFVDCRQSMFLDSCFYSNFENIVSRGGFANVSTIPAIEFTRAVNIINATNISVVDRDIAYKVSGGSYGMIFKNCSAEGGIDGFKILGETGGLSFIGCYFENLTGTAIEFADNINKNDTIINGCSFLGQLTCIKGQRLISGEISSNYFYNTTNTVWITDNLSSIKVILKPIRVAGNANAGVPYPTGIIIPNNSIQLQYPVHAYNPATGNTECLSISSVDTPTHLPFLGKQGQITNAIPFCEYNKTSGINFNIEIDTQIYFQSHSMLVFSLKIQDSTGTHLIAGRTYGNVVVLDNNPSSKTVSISGFGGSGQLCRLTIGQFNNPSGTMIPVEGIVRMI